MNEPKPFASLTPSILARKGGARPAMRPQVAPLNHSSSSAARLLEEDLGWNDMGDSEAELPAEPPMEAEIVTLIPHALPLMADRPEVLRQQDEVAERIAQLEEPVGRILAQREVVAKPVVSERVVSERAVIAARKRRERRSALSEGRRAAFTLRLDHDRHLQLRLACTMAGRSAQQLVTDALDKLISELPDVSAVAAKVREGRK